MIAIEKLTKRYGTFEALRGVDLSIESGGCVGLLGPNGAGKTTLVEILEGLREKTSGEVRVLGLDPARSPRELRLRIGVQLQATALPQELTVAEVLRLYAALYPTTLPAPAILATVDLESKARSRVRTLSGGERQRLALALALLHDPELLLLDEPTAGIDPEAEQGILDLLRELRETRGLSIWMVTHHVHAIGGLADRTAVVSGGRVRLDQAA
jgi:ABC-2 type transport system ATP-binding protein